nr:peptide chain release factor N(5)-glutamine methyltransferase [Rhizobium halophilum]
MRTLGGAVAYAQMRLVAAGLPDAAMEARILIAGLLGLNSTEIFIGTDRVLAEDEALKIASAVERRLKREPVHRILGEREFYGMKLKLSDETLEPRPDTEILVDAVLPRLLRLSAGKGSVRVLDLGTGTGAIILALLKECPLALGVAADISQDALQTAYQNAQRLGLADRFSSVQSGWYEKIEGRFDIIVSNPPYIATCVVSELEPEVKDFDPRRALDGGPDGLDAYHAIAAGASGFLERDGIIGVEIGFDQKGSVTKIFEAAGYELEAAERDYGGNDRVLLFSLRKPGA